MLKGDVELNPNCMMKEVLRTPDRTLFDLTKAVSVVLKAVFRRLGHDVDVFIDVDHPTRVFSDTGDFLEVAELKNICNMSFAAFFENNYAVLPTIEFLEKTNLIPPYNESLIYWKDRQK